MAKKAAIKQLLEVMARLRAPDGCPWDREQDHKTLRMHAVEEVYELLDAIDAEDDHEMQEELGDVLLQVVFHCQLAEERGAFDFEQVAQCQIASVEPRLAVSIPTVVTIIGCECRIIRLAFRFIAQFIVRVL